jgi:hypothetical protein
VTGGGHAEAKTKSMIAFEKEWMPVLTGRVCVIEKMRLYLLQCAGTESRGG